MEPEGFKFTFYVKPFYSEPENHNLIRHKAEEHKVTRARPVLALISNRNLNHSVRPYSHNAERHEILKKYESLAAVAEASLVKSGIRGSRSSTYRSRNLMHDLLDFKNFKEFKDIKDSKKSIKLFPVIHNDKKHRGMTPCALLRSKLQF